MSNALPVDRRAALAGARAAAARAHLVALAHEPRPAGGAAEARARAYAAGVLTRAGYAVREAPFSYSALVGRYGAPLLGAASASVLLAAAYAGVQDRPAVGGAAMLITLGALAAGIGWGSDRGVRGLRALRRDGVNLVAEPPARDGDAPPSVWLVAHLDSKSQPVAMALRVAGAAALAAAWTFALGLSSAHALGWIDGATAQPLWPVVALVAVLGAIPVMLSVVGGRSAGALDNASGVAAVLLAAEELAASAAVRDDGTAARRAPVGVLLTSAEELALAGARAWVHAWAQDGRAPGVALNCDGVDDRGRVAVLRVGGTPRALLAEARRAAPGARVRRMPPGVLMDAVAFDAAEWAALTVSRGTWGSLARVHTRRDTLDRLRGDGVPEAAGVLARLARLSIALTDPDGAD